MQKGFKAAVLQAYRVKSGESVVKDLISREAVKRKWSVKKLTLKVKEWRRNENKNVPLPEPKNKSVSKPKNKRPSKSAKLPVSAPKAPKAKKEKPKGVVLLDKPTKGRASTKKKTATKNSSNVYGSKKVSEQPVVCLCGCGQNVYSGNFMKGHANGLRQKFKKLVSRLFEVLEAEKEIKGLADESVQYAYKKWPELTDHYKRLAVDDVGHTRNCFKKGNLK